MTVIIGLQAWVGAFVGTAVVQSIVTDVNGAPPTPEGWAKLIASVSMLVLLLLLASCGALRGGFGASGDSHESDVPLQQYARRMSIPG